METTYYTLSARHVVVSGGAVAQAAGDERRCLVFARPAAPAPAERRGKVIDLERWRAVKAAEAEEPEEDEAPELLPAARRSRRVRRADLPQLTELLASLSVVAVMALLALRILVF